MIKRSLVWCAGLIFVVGLAGSIGCSDDDDPTNPGGGGIGADIDVVSSTPASGNTKISGSGVAVATSLEDADTTTRVQVTASSDGNLRQVLVYFDTVTGTVTAVSYWWGVTEISENIVYCPVAGCTAVTVDIVNRTIAFAGTALDNNGIPGPGDPPTKFATLGLAAPASLVTYPAP